MYSPDLALTNLIPLHLVCCNYRCVPPRLEKTSQFYFIICVLIYGLFIYKLQASALAFCLTGQTCLVSPWLCILQASWPSGFQVTLISISRVTVGVLGLQLHTSTSGLLCSGH